jgi:hypothetical protein
MNNSATPGSVPGVVEEAGAQQTRKDFVRRFLRMIGDASRGETPGAGRDPGFIAVIRGPADRAFDELDRWCRTGLGWERAQRAASALLKSLMRYSEHAKNPRSVKGRASYLKSRGEKR